MTTDQPPWEAFVRLRGDQTTHLGHAETRKAARLLAEEWAAGFCATVAWADKARPDSTLRGVIDHVDIGPCGFALVHLADPAERAHRRHLAATGRADHPAPTRSQT